jgi:hypothetical protein
MELDDDDCVDPSSKSHSYRVMVTPVGTVAVAVKTTI